MPDEPPDWGRRCALAAVIVAICLLAYFAARRARGAYDRFAIGQTHPVVAADGLPYRVHPGHAAPEAAANTLAEINSRITSVLRWLRRRYRGPAGDAFPARRAAVENLLRRYNPDNLVENSPADPEGDTSYTVDKGSLLALCLRGKRDYTLHDLDTLTFVTLHEMAHIAVNVIDHEPEFWSAFRFLLEEAERAGVYRSPDYARQPVQYCGVRIDYNPRWDPKTPSI